MLKELKDERQINEEISFRKGAWENFERIIKIEANKTCVVSIHNK